MFPLNIEPTMFKISYCLLSTDCHSCYSGRWDFDYRLPHNKPTQNLVAEKSSHCIMLIDFKLRDSRCSEWTWLLCSTSQAHL